MKASVPSSAIDTKEVPRHERARLLTGSNYGNTIQIWSALVMSALLGLALTSVVALLERVMLRHRHQP